MVKSLGRRMRDVTQKARGRMATKYEFEIIPDLVGGWRIRLRAVDRAAGGPGARAPRSGRSGSPDRAGCRGAPAPIAPPGRGAATSRQRLALASDRSRRAAAAAAIEAARSRFGALVCPPRFPQRPLAGQRARGATSHACHPTAQPAAPPRARRRAAIRRRARALRLGALQQAVRHGGGARQPAHPRGVLEAVPEADGERGGGACWGQVRLAS